MGTAVKHALTGRRESWPEDAAAETCGDSAGAGELKAPRKEKYKAPVSRRGARSQPWGHVRGRQPAHSAVTVGPAPRPRMLLVPELHGGRRLAAPPIPTRCQVCACHDCEFQVCLSRASVIFKLSFGVQEIKRWKKLQSDKAPMGSKMSQIKRGGNYMDLFTPFLVGKKGERFRRPHNSG